MGSIPLEKADVSKQEGGVLYRFSFESRGSINNKTFGRLWWQLAHTPSARTELRYRVHWGNDTSPEMRIPVEEVEIPPASAIPQRLTTSLSWWPIDGTMSWPEWKHAFSTLGRNAMPAFITWLDPSNQKVLDFVASARRLGYRIHAIDSTFHQMLSRRAKKSEIYCQFEDGTHSSHMCPSYRGKFYHEELERVATGVKLLQPSLLHCDIEIWGGATAQEVQKCTRCRADKEASGIASWQEWQLAKGQEIWCDLYSAVGKAAQEAGGRECEMGLYDGRPHENYQGFWPVGRLYPEYIQTSQVSTYSALEPFEIEYLGDEVRLDRRGRLPAWPREPGGSERYGRFTRRNRPRFMAAPPGMTTGETGFLRAQRQRNGFARLDGELRRFDDFHHAHIDIQAHHPAERLFGANGVYHVSDRLCILRL